MTSLVDSPSFQHKSVKTSRTFFERESATDEMFWKYFLWMPAIWKWFATSSHWVDLDFAFLFKIQLWLRLTLNKTLRALSWLLKGIDNIKVLECASPSFLSNQLELNYHRVKVNKSLNLMEILPRPLYVINQPKALYFKVSTHVMGWKVVSGCQ